MNKYIAMYFFFNFKFIADNIMDIYCLKWTVWSKVDYHAGVTILLPYGGLLSKVG